MHTEAIHIFSGNKLTTDAPIDHDGQSESFALTDLLATSLATCFLTVMGITAKKQGWYLGQVIAEVEKTMALSGLRRIDSIFLRIYMPIDLANGQLFVLQKAVEDCPVMRSLKKSLKIKIKWITHLRRCKNAY